jgi:hypothetical protein
MWVSARDIEYWPQFDGIWNSHPILSPHSGVSMVKVSAKPPAAKLPSQALPTFIHEA